MPTPIERAYGWQVRWKHAAIDDGNWQQVAFRLDEGQTIINARQFCTFLDNVSRRIADADPWVTSGRWRTEAPTGFTSIPTVRRGERFRDLITAYEEAKANRAERTIRQARQRHQRYFADWLDLAANDITTDMINSRWGKLLAPEGEGGWGMLPASARAMMMSVIPVLRYGYRHSRLKKNPVIKELIAYKLVDDQREAFIEPLTDAEFFAMVDLAGQCEVLPGMNKRRRDFLSPAEMLQLSLEVMGDAGLRIGEVLALAAEDMDLIAQVIHVDHHMVGNDREPGTKTGQKRTVPMTPALAERLAAVVARRKPADPLLPSVAGGFMTYNSWREVWDVFVVQVKAAGFVRSKVNLIPHLLRHSYASWQAPHIPAIALMQLMGHAQLSTTQRYYKRGLEAIEVGRNARQARKAAHGRGGSLADQNAGSSPVRV